MFAEHNCISLDIISAPQPCPLSPMGRGEEQIRVNSLAPVSPISPNNTLEERGERLRSVHGRVRGLRASLQLFELRKVPRRPSETGFSLMEVLVGVMILGIVYATLFGLMSGSLKNVSRIEEREKMVRYGEMKLNELVIRARQGELKQVLSGRFDDKYTWQARLEAYDTGEESAKNALYLVARIRLSIFWSGKSRFNQYDLETLTWVPKPKQTV